MLETHNGEITYYEKKEPRMELILLMTKEMEATKPPSITIAQCWDHELLVRFEDENIVGAHVCLRGAKEDFIKWLKPFNGVAIGKGVPQLQIFEIWHVKENL